MTTDDACVRRVFYDTEFCENGSTIELISIGMVADTGESFYGVNRDMPVAAIRRHKWLMANVVPHLPGAMDDSIAASGRLFDDTDRYVHSSADIAARVAEFLLGPGKAIELWADYGAYDHVALAQLFGPMIDLPLGIPMFTHDVQQEASRLGLVPDVTWDLGNVHHALNDAHHTRKVWQWLQEQGK